MKQNTMIQKVAISLAVVCAVASLIAFGWWLGVNSASQDSANHDTSGDNGSKNREDIDPRLHRIVEYQHAEEDGIQCAAIMPECGWCNGKIINKQCYVNDEQLAEYREYVPNVKVEYGVAPPN